MLAALALALVGTLEASARWRCEPATVAVGQPFTLALELEHDANASALELVHGEPAFDGSWVVLERRPARVTARGDGTSTTVVEWSVASLEPGERDLSAPLAAVGFAEDVKNIGVGDAHLAVQGVLGPDEDAPRPLREFPDGFAEEAGSSARSPLVWILAITGALAVGIVVLVLRHRRRPAPVTAVTPLEELAALERAAKEEGGAEGCYALTRLLREAADRVSNRPRDGLTDQEWLAGLAAAHELPSAVQEALADVLGRAARLKYAGEVATPWALEELFAGARAALEGLGGAPATKATATAVGARA